MASPYRIKAEVERPGGALVYLAGDRESRVAPARSALQIGVAGVTAGLAAAVVGFPQLGAGLLAGAVATALWRWRRGPELRGIALEVDAGDLTVTDRAARRVIARVRLTDLHDVTLDTKSIRKVEPGRDVIPAVQFIASQIGPEIDVARIVLEVEGRLPIRLTEAFLSHTESVEWIAKIRLFLRAHGWVPADERSV